MSTLPSGTTPATETAAVKPTGAAVEPAPRATAAAKVVTRPPAGARRVARSYAIAIAAIVIVIAALALPGRPMPAGTPPSAADLRPRSHEGLTDRDSSAHPIVAASTAAPASEFMPTAAPVAHPIAAIRAAGEVPKNTPARAAKNLAAVSSAPIPAATPVAETHAKADSPADTEPTGTVPASALLTVESAALAQVTITGCLEISTGRRSLPSYRHRWRQRPEEPQLAVGVPEETLCPGGSRLALRYAGASEAGWQTDRRDRSADEPRAQGHRCAYRLSVVQLDFRQR